MDVRGKNIFVGLSGGVDSAVSAALLLRAGARVTGVFVKGWYPPGMPCTWAEERRDAMRIAAKLHIPFRTLDASEQYKQSVIDYLLSEYRAGRTPNPDVMCNKDVKFGAFFRYAISQRADYIATGHYRAGEKDQSYFLWAVPKEVLEKAIFPVGQMKKEEVRALARKFDLPVSEKKDSQGVCFLGSVSVEDFLRAQFGQLPGNAVDEDGKEIGSHDGVLLHTLGERVALMGAAVGPWYVVRKDIPNNTLVVGRGRAPRETDMRGIPFAHENWITKPQGPLLAQYRYRGPKISGRIEGRAFVADERLPEVPAPGQSLVFYEGAQLLGGGIITE